MTSHRPDHLTPTAESLAEEIGRLAGERKRTVATAESLTGGKLACHFAAAPESSEWFRGSVVAYASEVKYDVLGVPVGPVISQRCAEAMARGVARLLGADWAVAVSGVGGPDEQEGHPPGTVWFGFVIDGEVHTERQHFEGEPPEILEKTTLHALTMMRALATVEDMSEPVDESRVAQRAELLPEEEVVGSDDPALQAEAILEESDERTEHPERTRQESTQTPD